MSMCVCDCPGLPSNSPCYCTDTLQTWRKELDKIPSAHTITGAYHSPGLGSFNCATALLCVNTSVTCAPMGERAVCYAHSASGIPSDQVHLIHAEGEAVASYPGHMGGEMGSIATAKKEADCFSVAVQTQLQYSFVIAYPECNIHLYCMLVPEI